MIDGAFWRGRRVLLTGHTGFKGAWLGLWLHELGASVTGFAGPPGRLFELARGGELLDDVRGDLRDAAAVRAVVERARPEVVLHLGAQAIVRRALADPVETYETNVGGTALVLAALHDLAPEAAVVVVTSDKCFANDGAGRPFREDDPLGGHDPYSSSKAAQELVAAAFRDSYGLRIATARAGNVIGGGDWGQDRLVPDFVRAAEAGGALVVRNAACVRPWQHVLNPLAGYLRLAERLAAGPEWARAWNFGPEPSDERPVAWLVERLREAWPVAVDVEVARDGDAIEAPVLRLDSALARERLGWAPRWDLARGVAETAAWYRDVAGGADARAVTLGQIRAFGG
jgi:CDP-glucose 4,6-dehydratase